MNDELSPSPWQVFRPSQQTQARGCWYQAGGALYVSLTTWEIYSWHSLGRCAQVSWLSLSLLSPYDTAVYSTKSQHHIFAVWNLKKVTYLDLWKLPNYWIITLNLCKLWKFLASIMPFVNNFPKVSSHWHLAFTLYWQELTFIWNYLLT